MGEEDIAALKVRCLALTLHHNLALLVPNTMVAEVIDFRPVEDAPHMPDWVSGMLSWRGRNVPLVSFERLLGMESLHRQDDRRYVIFNTLNGNKRVPFTAMAIIGIPHLAMVSQTQLETDDDNAPTEPAVLASLRYDGESVIVPNLDVIERMLEHLGVTAA